MPIGLQRTDNRWWPVLTRTSVSQAVEGRTATQAAITRSDMWLAHRWLACRSSVACMGSPPLQALHTAGRHDGSGLAGMSRRSDDSPASSADQAPVLTAVNRLCAGVMGARCRHTLMQQSTLRPRACLRRHKHSKHSVQQGG